MNIKADKFRLRPGKKVELSEWPTEVKPFYNSDQEYKEILADHVEQLSILQNHFYAFGRYSLLLIFQGMDTSGKDGVIRHVMSGINPEGCEVVSFKQPSAEELKHDFLWRAASHLPERGYIGIFNRSYYEEVLIVRVHADILHNQPLPFELLHDNQIWQHRFDSINHFERHLYNNGTRVIKFFLHLSKKEQKNRLLARIDQPKKNWKLSIADIEERKLWKHYMSAYNEALHATSTQIAPWHIVPADDKDNARLIVSQVILDSLNELKITYPSVGKSRRDELKEMRKLLLMQK